MSLPASASNRGRSEPGAGAAPGTDPGVDPGTDPGVDPETVTGVDPETVTGAGPGAATAATPAAAPAADPDAVPGAGTANDGAAVVERSRPCGSISVCFTMKHTVLLMSLSVTSIRDGFGGRRTGSGPS